MWSDMILLLEYLQKRRWDGDVVLVFRGPVNLWYPCHPPSPLIRKSLCCLVVASAVYSGIGFSEGIIPLDPARFGSVLDLG
jgi:hypothetical protein